MKQYIVKTTEELIYSCEYLIEAESEKEARELWKKGDGELVEEQFLECISRDIDDVIEYDNN